MKKAKSKKRIKVVSNETKRVNKRNSGLQLGELLNVPVYRIKEGAFGRSYMDLFGTVIVPFLVSDKGVYVLEYSDIGFNGEIELDIMENDSGWEDMTSTIKEASEIQERTGVEYSLNRLNKFKNHLEEILSILKKTGYITIEETESMEEIK